MTTEEQNSKFEYDCPKGDCEGTMYGDYGEDVQCPECGALFHTDWEDSYDGATGWWLCGEIKDE